MFYRCVTRGAGVVAALGTGMYLVGLWEGAHGGFQIPSSMRSLCIGILLFTSLFSAGAWIADRHAATIRATVKDDVHAGLREAIAAARQKAMDDDTVWLPDRINRRNVIDDHLEQVVEQAAERGAERGTERSNERLLNNGIGYGFTLASGRASVPPQRAAVNGANVLKFDRNE
jgi:hypothetical protein